MNHRTCKTFRSCESHGTTKGKWTHMKGQHIDERNVNTSSAPDHRSSLIQKTGTMSTPSFPNPSGSTSDVEAWITHSNAETITYFPAFHVRNLQWISPLDVLSFLLLHPSDRDGLRNEATRRSPYQVRGYFVYHHLLGRRLWITSFDTDQQFVQTLQTLFIIIEIEQGIVSTVPPPTFLHTDFIHIRDPHGMVEDVESLARLLAPYYQTPHEVLILMRDSRASPLYY
jgi:hypothetical protein